MFDVISLGEYTLLADAFNGLAMIFNSGPIANMMKLAFLVGILWFGVRAAFFSKWDATPLLAGLIGYMCMFGPKVTVTVTDAYSGAVRVVANVPVGIAAPMGITSHTGRYFAATFEQAFAVTTPTGSYFTEGYLNALEVLLKMRAPNQGWASVAANSRIEATLLSYLKDCVYLDLAMNDPGNAAEVDAHKLTTAKDTWANLRTTFVNVYTTDYINMVGNQPSQRPCKAVYERLDAQIGTPGTWISTYYDNFLQTQMASSRQAFSASAEIRIGNALAAINMSAADARTWMMNTMLGTALRNADSAYQVGQNNVAGTVMVTQAAAQRNAKWTAEKSMFEQVSRPITAFIELFMVGASPIMAFAIAAFGHAGFSILGKFLLMHVWVTLWVPTTALVNAYMTHTMAKYVEWVQDDRGIQLLSQAGLEQLNSQLQTQYATGGMLAAAVPMLTLMLIYGSSQVATQLASQMRGSEYIDPKIAAPDLVQPGPVITQASSWTANPAMGTMQRTGATVGTLDVGSTLQQGASLSRSVAETNSVSASQGLNTRYALTEGSGERISVSRDGTLTGTGTYSRGIAAVYNRAFAAAKESGMSTAAANQYAMGASDAYTNATTGNVGINGNLGGGVPGGPSIGIGGGAGKAWASTFGTREAREHGVSEQQLEAANKRLSASASEDESVRAGLEYAKSNRDSTSKAKDYSTGASIDNARTITNAITQTQEATKTATTMDSVARRLGVGANYSPTQLRSDWERTFGGGARARAEADFQKGYSHLSPEMAARQMEADRRAARESGTFQNVRGNTAEDQAMMEMLWVMANKPNAAFAQSMGKVSGMELGDVGAKDPAAFVSSVNQDGLSNANLLNGNGAGHIWARGNEIQDAATGKVGAAALNARRWEQALTANFSPDAIRQFFNDKGGDVSASAAEFRAMSEKASAMWNSGHAADRLQLQGWFMTKTTDQLKEQLLGARDQRGVVAEREGRERNAAALEAERQSPTGYPYP